MHTPLLLRRSGLDSPHIGRHLTLHPAVRIGALFDEAVDGWDGALQSVYTDHFLEDGIWLNGVYSAVNVLAAEMGVAGHSIKMARNRGMKKLKAALRKLGYPLPFSRSNRGSDQELSETRA